jgi:hypothetical protein
MQVMSELCQCVMRTCTLPGWLEAFSTSPCLLRWPVDTYIGTCTYHQCGFITIARPEARKRRCGMAMHDSRWPSLATASYRNIQYSNGTWVTTLIRESRRVLPFLRTPTQPQSAGMINCIYSPRNTISVNMEYVNVWGTGHCL